MTARKQGRPTAGDARSAALRTLARQIVDLDHDGNQAAAARACGFTAGALSKLLAGGGAGYRTADALAAYVRRSVDQILAAGGDLNAIRSLDPPPAPAQIRSVRFGELPNWSELLETAREIEPRAPAWVWSVMPAAEVWLDVPVTAQLVHDLAIVAARHVSPRARSVP